MMKKKIFDLRLYLEHVRQLRVFGIAALILFSLAGVISVCIAGTPPLFADTASLVPDTVSLFDIQPMWPLFFCLFAPLITLFAFSFLNKRATSDFYHSIPYTRTCLFFCVFAAVLSWVTVVLLGSTLVASVTTLFFPRMLLLHTASLPVLLFTTWTGCLFVMAAVALAMSVTGTFFSNVLVALMIIFVPRLLVSILSSTLAEALPLLAADHLISWLPSFENTSTAVVLGIFTNLFGITGSYLSWTNGLYTLLISVLLLAAGTLLFRKRRSETAGSSAPNRAMQAVYRLVLCGLPCVGVCCAIFTDLMRGSSVDVVTVVAAYLIILAVYFLYELISTRRVRNLVRAIPALGFLVLINLATLAGLHLMYNRALALRPEADDIRAVQIVNDVRQDYFAARCASIEFEDPALRQMVARQLQYTADFFRDADSKEDAYTAYYRATADHREQTVAIRCGIHTYYRNILITAEDQQLINDCIGRSQEYRALYTDLPEKVDYVDFDNAYYLPQADVRQIYQTLRQEVKDIPFDQWYAIIGGSYGDFIDTLTIRTTVDGVQYRLELPVSTATPQALALYAQKILRPDVQETLLYDLQQHIDRNTGAFNIYLRYFPMNAENMQEDSSYFRQTGTGEMIETAKQLKTYLVENTKNTVDISRLHLVFVSVYNYNDSKEDVSYIPDYSDVAFLLANDVTFEQYRTGLD